MVGKLAMVLVSCGADLGNLACMAGSKKQPVENFFEVCAFKCGTLKQVATRAMADTNFILFILFIFFALSNDN